MSDLTSPSFIDDGVSFAKRIPNALSPSRVSLDTTSSTSSHCSTSAYTGSFIDDGADMRAPPPHKPGFGEIDAHYYGEKKKRGKDVQDMPWNDAMQTAITGDVKRNLDKIRELGHVSVRRREGKLDRTVKRGETVRIAVPRKLGTFFIRGKDGRMIVVDEDNEFDSGAPHVEERGPVERWIEAASTVESVVLRKPGSGTETKEKTKEMEREQKERKHRDSHRRRRTQYGSLLSPSLNPLIPIHDSGCEAEYEPSNDQGLASSAGFFMSGGASGWPYGESTPIASPETSETAIRPRPGGWPSPLQSTTRSTASSKLNGGDTSSWAVDLSRPDKHSHRSGQGNPTGKGANDNRSTRPYSTYQGPTVEDARNTSSESVHRGNEAGPPAWSKPKVSRQGSDASWKSGEKSSANDWDGAGKVASEKSWNGFERTKAVSEVGVVGSGSECSTSSSSTHSRHSEKTHHSQHGRGSRARRDGSGNQTGWGGSQVSRQSWSSETAHVDDGWEDAETSDRGWSDSRARSGAGRLRR